MSSLVLAYIAAAVGAGAAWWVVLKLRRGKEAERQLEEERRDGEVRREQTKAAINAPRTRDDLTGRLRDKRRPF